MVVKTIIKLEKKQIEKLKQICRIQTLVNPTPLFYQGHVPMVAYLVLDGAVNLTKNKKLKTIVRSGGVIGAKELITHSPSTVTAEAHSNTTVCYLDRSTVQDIMNNGDPELSHLFQEYFESHAS